MLVKDKVVIITGGGSGIGEACARLFAQHQAKVVVSDINLAQAERVAADISKNGGTAIALQTDVTQYEQVENLIHQTIEKFQKLDVMVNNAGIGGKNQFKTAGMKLALQQMVKQGFGNIVNIASLAGLKASGNNLSYSASKFAVVGMTKSAALEYASNRIRINAVCPGYTESALLNQLKNAREDMEQILVKMIPMKRFGQPEEIAEAVVWLASDNTQFITGQTITIDGGLSL